MGSAGQSGVEVVQSLIQVDVPPGFQLILPAPVAAYPAIDHGSPGFCVVTPMKRET
jgi:hypothetical protein